MISRIVNFVSLYFSIPYVLFVLCGLSFVSSGTFALLELCSNYFVHLVYNSILFPLFLFFLIVFYSICIVYKKMTSSRTMSFVRDVFRYEWWVALLFILLNFMHFSVMGICYIPDPQTSLFSLFIIIVGWILFMIVASFFILRRIMYKKSKKRVSIISIFSYALNTFSALLVSMLFAFLIRIIFLFSVAGLLFVIKSIFHASCIDYIMATFYGSVITHVSYGLSIQVLILVFIESVVKNAGAFKVHSQFEKI